MKILNLTLFSLFGAFFTLFFNIENWLSVSWKLLFQENATPQREELEELHNYVIFHLSKIPFALILVILLCIIIIKITNRIANLFSSNVMDLNNILEPKVTTILKKIDKEKPTKRLNLKIIFKDDYAYLCDKLDRRGSDLIHAYIPTRDPTLYPVKCRSYTYNSYCLGKTRDLYREALMVQGELCSGTYLNILSNPNVHITSEGRPLLRNEEQKGFVIIRRGVA